MTRLDAPTIVSTWGQDFQGQAKGSVLDHARHALRSCDGFMADNHADVRLAKEFGLPETTPSLVVPGNMGLATADLRAALAASSTSSKGDRAPLVVFPRGARSYIDYETFVDAIPRVLELRPDARVVCIGLGRNQQAAQKAVSFGSSVTLMEQVPQKDLWRLFAEAAVVVSPGRTDGLPNSVIEAAALGAVVVVYELVSLVEVLEPPMLGYTVPQGDEGAMAKAIVDALDTPAERRNQNIEVTIDRFEAQTSLRRVLDFYGQVAPSMSGREGRES
ncbi:Glycosyl transferases group 1 [Actinopolymorpha cephalotaxi]|nr:Glycosyl transferases group 1 [Actinopolymorpha cephalotaxi]